MNAGRLPRGVILGSPQITVRNRVEPGKISLWLKKSISKCGTWQNMVLTDGKTNACGTVTNAGHKEPVSLSAVLK